MNQWKGMGQAVCAKYSTVCVTFDVVLIIQVCFMFDMVPLSNFFLTTSVSMFLGMVNF